MQQKYVMTLTDEERHILQAMFSRRKAAARKLDMPPSSGVRKNLWKKVWKQT